MLTLPPAVRVFISTAPTDMRKSFDSLAAAAEHVLSLDPLSGHLFVFRNKRGDRVKLLHWDRTGYVIWYKRLEKGVFHFPEADTVRMEIEAPELMLLLEGIDLAGSRRRDRFVPGARAVSLPA